MYNPEELVTVKWSQNTRKHFENMGYEYTGLNKEFQVKVKDLLPNSNVKITVACDCDGCTNTIKLPLRNYNKAIQKYGIYRCKSCSHMDNIRIRTEKSHERLYQIFLDKCREHGDIPITTYEEFGGSKSYVEYECHIHGKTKTLMSNIISSDAWCYMCGKDSMAEKVKLSQDEVKNMVEGKNNNILLNPEEYINVKTKNLRIICGSCGNEHVTSLSSIYNSDGRCSTCGWEALSQSTKTTKEQMIEKTKINGEQMVVNSDDYIDMYTPILFYCSECGEPFLQSPHNYGSRGFSRCNNCWNIIISKAAIRIGKLLDNLGINYIKEYRFNDCRDIKPLPFDFYLYDYNLIIEYDGEQHFRPIPYFGGQKSFERTQRHDRMKNAYCKEHIIPILRIPYWEEDNVEELVLDFLKINNLEDIVQSHVKA